MDFSGPIFRFVTRYLLAPAFIYAALALAAVILIATA